MIRLRGFTLIELLVATFILAILGSMAYRGLTAVQDTERHLADVGGRWQDIARVVDRLGRDIRQASERPGRDSEGRSLPPFWGRMDNGEQADLAPLSFSRLGGDGQDTRCIAYRRRDDTLELLAWPSPEAAGQPPRSYRLLDGVKEFRLAYLDPAGTWQAFWPLSGSTVRPRAVKINLVLAEGVSIERIIDLP